mgnify:FL=1
MHSIIKSVYDSVVELFPEDSGKRELLYVRRNWIFPNHIDIMLDLINDMCSRYGGDIVVCPLAAILHDTGLVYKRTSASSENHEKRSLEYAEQILKKHNIDANIIKSVLACISATEPKNEPKNVNEKIVRTADALSQFISVHFIAKAAFSESIEEYFLWLSKKLDTNFNKICFEQEQKKASPILEYYKEALKRYYAKRK